MRTLQPTLTESPMATSHAPPTPARLAPRQGDADAAATTATTVRAPARERWSWALYDFANTIWSMNVATLYFSVGLISDLGAANTADAVAKIGVEAGAMFDRNSALPMTLYTMPLTRP